MNQQVLKDYRKANQLDIFEKLEEIRTKEKPYRNGLGELLPWEVEEIKNE